MIEDMGCTSLSHERDVASLLFGHTTSIKFAYLAQQSISFAKIAFIVRRLNIVFGMSAASRKWNHMIEVQNVVRKNGLITNMAMHSITLKNMLVTDNTNSCIAFSSIPTTNLLINLMRIRLTPYPILLSPLIRVSNIIPLLSLSYLFSMNNAIISCALLMDCPIFSIVSPSSLKIDRYPILVSLSRLFSMICCIILHLLSSLFAVDDIVIPMLLTYSLQMSGAIIPIAMTHLFSMGSVPITASLSVLFTMTGAILSTILTCLFEVGSSIILIAQPNAILTVSVVPIFAFAGHRELFKRFFFVTTGTDFRGKQGKLMSVIYFAHDKGYSLSSRLGVLAHRQGTTILPHYYSIDPPLKSVYPIFLPLIWEV